MAKSRKMRQTKKSKKMGKSRKMRQSRKMRKSLGKRHFFSRMNGGDEHPFTGTPYLSRMRGGDNPPLIGPAYTPTNLPGQAGIDGVSNYYPYNTYAPFDPQTQNIIQERDQTTLSGGSRRRGRKGRKMKRGGGFLPQDLVNVGRTMTYGLGSAYNAINGYPAPVNPMPYNDQLTKEISYL
jgi:hypothetical protein